MGSKKTTDQVAIKFQRGLHGPDDIDRVAPSREEQPLPADLPGELGCDARIPGLEGVPPTQGQVERIAGIEHPMESLRLRKPGLEARLHLPGIQARNIRHGRQHPTKTQVLGLEQGEDTHVLHAMDLGNQVVGLVEVQGRLASSLVDEKRLAGRDRLLEVDFVRIGFSLGTRTIRVVRVCDMPEELSERADLG